ncbi:MAG: M56 family metallopeptidase [Acidobacteriota bacterium]
MNGIATLAATPTVQAIAWALVHFLWQGALVGLVAAAALHGLRSRSASARYVTAVGALLVMLLLPVVTAIRIAATATTEQAERLAIESPGFNQVQGIAANVGPLAGSALSASAASPAAAFRLSSFRAALSPALPSIFGLWFVGVGLLAIYHLGGWRQVRRLAGTGRPVSAELAARVAELGRLLGVSRAVGLVESAAVSVPVVIGWLRPVILVPASTLVGLAPWQIEAVLAHELAHVRRNDALANLLQAAVETLLFFHPAVWWVSTQVRVEREHCCDDLAVGLCGNPLNYARALADLEGLRAPLPRWVLAANGGSLLDRVRRLAGVPPRPAGRSWIAGLLALSILPFGLTLQWGGGVRAASNGAGGSSQVAASNARRGSWTANRHGDRIDLESTMSWESVGGSHRWHVGETYPTKDFVGLTAGPDVHFELRREAGSFLFEGRFDGAKGSGSFTFAPDPAYPKAMAAIGYKVDPEQQIELAMQDVSVTFAREIQSLGLRDTTLDQLMQMRIQGVTADYARALDGLGIKDLSADQLVQLKIQGVSPNWIRGLNTAGYRDLSSDQLVQLKIQGVSAEWANGLTAAGYRDLTADQLVQLKIQGVSAPWVRELANAGYPGLSAEELVQLRIQGVTGDFVRQAVGRYGKLSAEELLQLTITGRRDR